MKIKYLVFSLLCTFPSLLFSQLAAQNFIVEGSAATQLLERNNESEFVFVVSPTISYFLSDKFVVGGGFLLATNLENGTNFGLNGKARYYFSNQAYNAWFAESKLGFIAGGGLNLFTGDIGLGLDLFLGPNIAIENTLSVGFQKERDIIGNTIVFQLGTGLKFFFDRKPEGSANGRNGILQKGTIFLGMTAGNIGELGGGIQLSTFSGDFVINETNTDPTFNFGLGVNYFLRPSVAFEVKGSYSNFRQSSFIDVNTIGLNFGFQFFLGKT